MAKTKKKAATVSASGQIIPKLELSMPLDARKIKAIQKCIDKGRLTLTIGKVDLKTGRIGDGWLYD